MRPEILFPLFAPIGSLKGVGPKIEPLVEKLAGPLVRDLAFLAPSDLVHRALATAATAVEGEAQTFVVSIDAHFPPAKFGYPYKIRTYDGTGFITLAWFKGGGPHLERQYPVGQAGGQRQAGTVRQRTADRPPGLRAAGRTGRRNPGIRGEISGDRGADAAHRP